VAVGIFGFVITLGLFAYEIYGIEKCDALIRAGKQLEGELRSYGQFIGRPHEVNSFINEPFAAGIIYPTVLAAWIFLALVSVLPQCVWSIPFLLFLVFLAFSLCNNSRLKLEGKVRDDLTSLNGRILEAEEDGDQAKLEPLIADDFTIVRAGGLKQDRKEFLQTVSANAHRGRTVYHLQVHPFGDCAVVTCCVTTSQNNDGAPTVGHLLEHPRFYSVNRGVALLRVASDRNPSSWR
jgi:Domain of unknown function (DUF4440)